MLLNNKKDLTKIPIKDQILWDRVIDTIFSFYCAKRELLLRILPNLILSCVVKPIYLELYMM